MRILHLHCDHIEYTPTKREIPAAEELDPRTVRLEEVLVAFVAVEKGDDDAIAARAILQIKSVMERLGCGRLLLYPYAHLSADLAPARIALDVMEQMSAYAKDIESYRSAFGWTKSYAIKVKGHPLAEGLKIIRGGSEDESEAVRAESKIESHWYVMAPDGSMTPVSEFDFSDHEGLEVLAKYEAAKKRGEDRPPPHVGLMKRLAIADYEPASDQGNMRYYPNGRLIKSLIERYVTKQVREYGGFEVETPIMYDSDHPSMIKYFNRFPARQYTIDSEGKQLFLRFAACFGQFLMANDFQMSYKNLPYRLYELTRYSFRREQSGELVGLRRLRAFTMPDCHAFCADMEQAVAEAGVRFELSRDVLRELGVRETDYEMAVRFTRDFYDNNPQTVVDLVAKHGKPVLVEMWDQRFFYFVLKWEFNYIDSTGKASALSTDQIDVENGSRYGIEFVDNANQPQNPIILHNSPSGAIERIIYSLLETAAQDSRQGRKPFFPLWLSPTQVRIIPVHEDAQEYAAKMADKLAAKLVRADIDERNESIGKRVREAEKEWIPYVVVVGGREVSAGLDAEITVRDRRGGGMLNTTLDDLISNIRHENHGKPYAMLNQPRLLSKRPQIMV